EARLSGRAHAKNVTCFEKIRARSATMTLSYEEKVFSADLTAEGVFPEIDPRLRPSGGAPVEGVIRIDPDGAGTMELSAGPFLYADLLARLDARLPRTDLLVRADGDLRWTRGVPGSLEGSLDVGAEPAASMGGGSGGPAPPTGGEPAASTGEGAERPVVPIHATAHAGIGQGEVRLGDGRISAPGLETALAGRISTDGRRTELEIPVERMDLEPTLRALAGIPAARFALAQELNGTAAGRIAVSIRDGAAMVRGSLIGSDLTLGPGATQVRIPRAEIPFTASGGAIDIRGMSLAGFGWTAEGSLGLSTSAGWPLRRAHARFQGAPASPLWAALALEEMEGGTISGSAVFDLDDAGGNGGEGALDLRLVGGRLAGIDLLDARLLATERGGTCHIDRLEAASAAGRVSARGVWSPDSGEGDMEISARELQLGDLLAAWAPDRKGDQGIVTIEGRARLTPGAIAFQGSGHASGLETAGFPLGSMRAHRIEYSAGAGGAGLEMDLDAPYLGATGRLRLGPEERAPLHLSLTARGLDLARLHPLLGEEALPGLGGRADLTLEGAIPPGDPWAAEIDGRLQRLSL
ncbi:MAG: hypothetical protein L0027_17740, partial [Candidatus Rokubacteria bacterium]|nr:hypothetical protein [Candidatus Rokubacteria bacterium]